MEFGGIEIAVGMARLCLRCREKLRWFVRKNGFPNACPGRTTLVRTYGGNIQAMANPRKQINVKNRRRPISVEIDTASGKTRLVKIVASGSSIAGKRYNDAPTNATTDTTADMWGGAKVDNGFNSSVMVSFLL